MCFTKWGAGQDFSNKGRDFWVGYGYHVRMVTGNGGSQQMVLYFATESVTTVTVSIPGLGYSITYSNIPANTIFTTNPLPKTGAQDSRLTSEGIFNKGIHIQSDKPIVAYAHIYDGNVSGATLLFPTNTLGKEYYSVNFDQVSNENQSNCWFYAIAVDTGTTVVQITPAANTLSHAAGNPFTVNLQQGQIINLMGQLIRTGSDPYTGVDLTGSTIKSISSGTSGCKRIAVFSGSGKISVTCNGGSSSADNYIVQAFPKTAWGKRYLTTPTRNFPYNYYRVCVSDPSTVVKFNGAVLSGLVNSFYYEFAADTPGLIEADKPILVAQYITSQNACGNGNPGDPEVIYLSPVEQNIDKVILNSTPNSAIQQHFINVVIRSSVVNSFKLDGGAVSGFQAHPRDASFSYAQLPVGAGKHTLQADSGFNAIAYGYGPAESYGYNAGTNVKDLYQFASIQNQYATVNFPAACRNSPFYFAITFPYQPTQIKWQFGAVLNGMGLADVTVNSPTPDSTFFVNGKQLYRYKLPKAYTILSTGTYPIRIVAQNPTPEGCSGEQEIDYDLQVFERPSAKFSIAASGCVSDSVGFTDNSDLSGRTSTQWRWAFGDNTTSTEHEPAHLYKTPGNYSIQYALISDIGCLSDTATQTIAISEPPLAKFGFTQPTCVSKAVRFTDSSSTSTSSISKWTWNFGDNTPLVVTTSKVDQTHAYANAGTFTVSLQVENASGCQSLVFTRQIKISANPVVDFSFGNACLPSGTVQFANQSTIADGTQSQLSYVWTFGDGGTSAVKDPSHSYKTVGPYQTKLLVTANSGCVDSATKTIETIYEQPTASFSTATEICLGANVIFTGQGSAPNSTVSKWEWDFGDGSPLSNQQNPSHNYATAGSYPVTLKITSAIGCVSAVATKNVVVNPLPTANFTLPTSTCVESNLSFDDASKPNAGTIAKWTWNFGDGTPTSNQSSPSHLFSKPGVVIVSLQVETDKGCVSGVASRQVTIHSQPNVGFVLPDNCVNDPAVIFKDTSSIADGSQAQFQHLWNFGDNNSTPAANTSTSVNGQHQYSVAGNYTVSLQITSRDGCIASRSQSFTLNGGVPVARFSLQSSAQHCAGDSISVLDNSNVTPGRLTKLEIYWDYNGDPTDKLQVDFPVKGKNYSHAYPSFYTPAAKSYHIKYVVYSGVNCITEKDTTILLNALPQIVFNPSLSVCANSPAFSLSASVTNMTTGTGVYTGKGVTAAGLFNPAEAGEGMHPVRFTYTSATGCAAYKEQSMNVFVVPTVSAGPDKFVLEGGSTVLNGQATGNDLQFLWSPSSGLNNATVAQPVASPVADIIYTLLVTTANGCKASDEVLVKLLKTPSIPNAFSPNGDGVHDRWEIQYLDSYPGATVEVFNRYGQKVFESKGYSKPWDGTVNGKPLPMGTYYYIIDPKNIRKPMTGFVDIIR